MRLFEALLLLAIGLTLLLLLMPPSRTARWVGLSICVAIMATVTQAVTEGSRWQLAPAYLLLVSFCLLWKLRKSNQNSALTNKKASCSLVAGSAIFLGVATMAVSVALPIILPVFAFPRPSGDYAIGSSTYHWTDASRPEVFSNAPRTTRELMVQIWYPADQKTSPAPYVDDAAILSAALARLHGMPAFLFNHLSYVNTNASASMAVSTKRPNFPVLIFLEGITGYRQMNMFQIEELVSQGYIIVAIDQPYVAASVTFPRGRTVAGLSKVQMDPLIQQSIISSARVPTLNGQAFASGIIPYLAQDVSFAINMLTALNGSTSRNILKGRVDLNSVGTFGVSLGGIVVGEACRVEPRIRACLVMDAPMPSTAIQSGLDRPVMWITRDAKTMRREGWAEADIIQHQRTMRAAFDRSRSASYFVQVRGMFHANLTDAPLFSPLTSKLGITGPIDGRRAHAAVNAYSLAFFDRHLRGRSAPLLDRHDTRFPEVSLNKRRSLRR